MRRFYFHLSRNGELLADEEGQELPDASTARREAEQAARELLAEAIRDGTDQVAEAFIIADEHGRQIDTVPLESLLPKSLRK